MVVLFSGAFGTEDHATADDGTDAIQTVLRDVDRLLRQRLADIGAAEIAHILVAVAPDGSTVVSGNVDAEGLKALAQDLSEAADEAKNRPPDEETDPLMEFEVRAYRLGVRQDT